MTRKMYVAGEGLRDYTPEENAEAEKSEAQEVIDAAKREIQAKIETLEDKITPRRIRDALASDEGKKWVADVEAEIAKERAKL